MMGQLRFAGILAAACAFFSAADQAQAAVDDRTYGLSVLSTVSGGFGGVLYFSAEDNPVQRRGTFFLDTEQDGRGTYDQSLLGLTVSAQGNDGDDYRGQFRALSIGPVLIGAGSGNAGDIFVFFGRVIP